MSRWLILILAIALSGCATYSDSFDLVEKKLASKQYDAALQEIEKQANSGKDKVLYLLNKGMVLRMKRDFISSNQALEAAKSEMERLYAESISENALSFVLNDATVSYAGDDYEQVLVHLFMALNYLEMGQLNDARVEALQVDAKLREIGEDIPDSKFTEDALSRYLSGMIYEELGEWSDAMIAYRKAYEAYKKYQASFKLAMPDMLKHDLLRLAKRQGLAEEVAQYKQEFGLEPISQSNSGAEQEGELVFVFSNGLAPIKREKIISATAPLPVKVAPAQRRKSAAPPLPVVVNIALPYYVSRANRVRSARIRVSGKEVVTQVMEDIDAIARESLDGHMVAITARSIARAVSKVAIQKTVDRAGKGGGDNAAAELVGSLFVRVAAIATERADTRSWLTLPANIQMARLSLPPGSYAVTVDLLGEKAQVIQTLVHSKVVIRKNNI